MTGTCSKCGDCCRFLLLPVPQSWFAQLVDFWDVHQWLGYHGVSIVEGPNRKAVFKVPLACQNLQGDGTCGIYNDRLEMCRRWPYGPGDLELVPTCVLRFDE